MDIKKEIVSMARAAKDASRIMAGMSSSRKKEILAAMASAVEKEKDEILFENSIDVDAAGEAGLSKALIDRLRLDDKRISALASSIREIAALGDPVGEVISEWTRPSGIRIKKVRVPLGVVGMIYESRPNVTADAAALCLKSGNSVILRGGSEAINSNHAIVRTILKAGYDAGLPEGAVQFVETADRAAVLELIKLDGLVDLIIPRGSEQMIRFVREHAVVPVLAHGKGLCHTYVDKAADLAMAAKIAFNAKCQRPGVCNAMETLLVHKDIARDFLPGICENYSKAGVEVRGCAVTSSIFPDAVKATDEDWSTEYLDLKVSVKVVDSLEAAIAHINVYGSGHSEAIITSDEAAAKKFLAEVDAAAVFHNASTRLHDGSVFGLGAEIGISTQKLHARGTMGARELTTTKFLVYGNGNIRE
ncbi:MAG: glutamate-5-semialdehyde dehydrogenase [Elusimicrobia bacterium HGW-Elusimicrobia-1]|jgi:glutamate-5-semialdehyde dehydrogenase|nr:MAG: glutamate-5-semialdehyde dehydrogenase [Elusimicrobia bacterium HGW-Elusimicrobia-1]